MKIFKNKIIYSFLLAVVLLGIFIRPGLLFYKQKNNFFLRGYTAQYESLRRAYYSSQYVQKKNPGIIPDETFEAFMAGAFLRGINPILVTHDQPPLGRYMLALSILIFDNENTIMVPLFILSGIGIFLIAKLILKNTLISLIPLAIFVNEPLFLSKFTYSPLLEPIQLPFIIFSLYFFIQGVTKKNYKKWFILTSVMLGFVISIRFFILGLFLLLTMLIYLAFKKQFNGKGLVFLITLPIALVILLASYTRTIQDGSSLIHIFGIQKYIYFYHKSQLILPFSFWDLLLFNKWHTWWGTTPIISDPQWILIWPFVTFLTAVFLLLSLLKKILVSETEKIVLIWIIMYSLFLSVGDTSTRYFPPLLPFLYIISTRLILKTIAYFNKHEA